MFFWILFFGTIIPTFFLFIVVYYLYWIFLNEKEDYLAYKGMIIFQFDLYNRKLKKILPKNEKTIFQFVNRKSNNWIKFKSIINQIEMKEKYSNLIKKTMNSLDKKPQEKTIKTKGLIKDFKTTFLFEFLFFPETHASDFVLHLKWKPVKKLFKFKKSKIQKIGFEKIINNKLKYLGILSFDLNTEVKNVTKKINKLFFTLNKRKLKVHENKEVISLIYASSKKTKILKLFKKTKIQLEKNLKILGLNYLFSATSEHICKSVNTKQKYLKLFKLIRYFLIVSKQKNKFFITQNNFKFSKQNFNFYLKNLNTFKNDVSSQNLISNYIPIKNYKTSKKIIDFAYPKIASNIDKKMFNIFLQNSIFKEQLIDSHIEYLKNQDQNLVANINISWILKNYQKLKNKKIVYLLNIKQIFDLEKTQQIISLLQKKGFLFAIELSYFNTYLGIFIKRIKPKFIIIKSVVWKNHKTNKEKLFILLLTIKRIATKQNIKIIYENPPENISSRKREKIGLFFFYDFK